MRNERINVPQVAAEIAALVPELAKDSAINRATVIEGILNRELERQGVKVLLVVDDNDFKLDLLKAEAIAALARPLPIVRP